MEEDIGKIIKKQRKVFSKKKRAIRKKVKEEFLGLVEERLRSFREYLSRWCNGSEEEGKEAQNTDGKRV